MAWANTIDIPFTIYGGVSTGPNGGVNTLSGYTCGLTKFAFEADTTLAAAFNYISNDAFMWDFGDGTVVKAASADHIYKYPGVYNVTLVAYDSAGNEFLSTTVKQLSVTDFFSDKLEVGTGEVTTVKNIPAGVGNAIENPITVNRYSSLHSYMGLSAIGYTLNLYASGSQSNQLRPVALSKWSHLDRTWSFYTTITADDKSIQVVPVKQVSTTNEEIYYRMGQKFGAPFYQRVPLSAAKTTPTAVLVGTSGSAEFIYSDDTPKHSRHPVFVNVSLDFSKHSTYQSLLDGRYVSKHSGDIKMPTFYEAYSLTIPIRVRYRPAVELTFTSSGLRTMELANSKWQQTEVPFFVDLLDDNDTITENYPPLSAFQGTPGVPANEQTWVTNLSVVSSDTVNPALATNTNLLSANFYRYTDGQLPQQISSRFRGYFIATDTADTAHVVGNILVDDPPHYPKDVMIGCIGNRHTREVNTVFFQDTYKYDSVVGGVNVYPTMYATTVSPFVSSYTPFCSMVVYKTDTFSDTEILGIWSGSFFDGLSTFNTHSVLTSSINITGAWDGVGKTEPIVAPGIIQDYSTGIRSEFGLKPTGMCFDSTRGIWIALSAGGVVMRIDPSLDPTLGTSVGTLDRVIKFGDNYQHSDGRDFYETALVETDVNDDVWIGLTHPNNSKVQKYRTTALDTTLLSSYDFPEGVIPVDIVATNKNDLWVSTVDERPNLRDIRIKQQTVKAVSATADTITYEFKQHGLVGEMPSEIGEEVSLTTMISANHVMQISGFDDGFYDGKFLIESVDADTDTITVKSYLGKSNNLPETFMDQGGIDASIYSDHIYRIDNNFVVQAISGFCEPRFIVTDRYQNLWVAHNVNTITKVLSSGEIDTSIDVYDIDFANTYLSGGFFNTNTTYDFTASADSLQLGGISFDTYSNLLVVQAYESKVYRIPVNLPTLSSAHVISTEIIPAEVRKDPADRSDAYKGDLPLTKWIFGEHRAFGDWTGYRWMNKYKNTTGVRSVTGEVTLTLHSSGGTHTIAKINENFDPIETIKSYRTQPILIDKGYKLFDDFFGTCVGTISSSPNVLGRVIYEKIANFPDNHSDIDTCGINALYSLCHQHNEYPKNYNLPYPGGLGRIMNLLSISHKKLWGERSQYDRDFETYGTYNRDYGKNRGNQIQTDTLTYMVTAGQRLVVRQIHNNEHKLINPMYISGENTDPHYVDSIGLVSSYPLSSYNQGWGWGLGDAVTRDNVQGYYIFYEYVPYYSNILLEGVIDWNNPYTNISESQSGIPTWTGEAGIIDTMIDYELRDGLGLFNTTLSGTVGGVL